MSWLKRILGKERKKAPQEAAVPTRHEYKISLTETDQLEIASLFLKATRPSIHARPGVDESWRQKIGASIPQVVPSLSNVGLLREAGATEFLEAEFSLAKLKDLAKDLGLKVSGKKAALAHRISEAGYDPGKSGQSEALFICTDHARKLVEEYKGALKKSRQSAQSTTLELLKRGEISQACELVAQFESGQYWQRGMNVDWDTQAPKLLRDVKRLMKAKPAYLVKRFGKIPHEARLLAVMSSLWGVNNFPAHRAELVPENMSEDDMFICSDALRSHHPQGNGRSELEGHGIAFHWECIAKETSSTCAVCETANGQRYQPGKEPELPHAECECEGGCRCLYIHSLDDFD
jgi:hypothetical protein